MSGSATINARIAELDNTIEYLNGQLEQWHPDLQQANRPELDTALAALDRLLDEQAAAPPASEGGGAGERVTLTGTVRRRPLQYHYDDPAGLTSVTFQLQVPTRRTTPAGPPATDLVTYRCVAWGTLAGVLARSLHRGTRLTVHGCRQIEGRITDAGHIKRCVSIRVQHATVRPPAS